MERKIKKIEERCQQVVSYPDVYAMTAEKLASEMLAILDLG
jgi:hypothetical protein